MEIDRLSFTTIIVVFAIVFALANKVHADNTSQIDHLLQSLPQQVQE